MKTHPTHRFATLIALIAALAATAGVHASVLTFEDNATHPTNTNIPDTFGDNIAAAATGYNISNGATPNVDLTWSSSAGAWQFYNDSEWSAAQTDGLSVAANTFDILFTPDAGFGVIVDSFVFDDYAAYASGNTFDWTVYHTNDAGSVLASGTETTTNGQNLTVNTGLTEFVAAPLLLRFNRNAGDPGVGDDQAIDDIAFRQQAVSVIPAPAALPAGLALIGLAMSRRRR